MEQQFKKEQMINQQRKTNYIQNHGNLKLLGVIGGKIVKSKVVAVQEGLHDVARLLREKGYNVTTIDMANEAIDVIIYSNENNDYLAHNTTGIIDLVSYNQFTSMINLDEVGLDNIITTIEQLE